MKRNQLYSLTFSAMFFAIGLALPFLTGQIQQIGNMLLPMHLPVMLCGLVCGKFYGLVIGAALPIVRSLIFGMPMLFPNAIAMSAELAVYGFMIGFVYYMLKKGNVLSVYIALIVSMLSGRVVWGAVMSVLLSFGERSFTFALFISGAFLNAIPGILLQLILVPSLFILLKRTGVLKLTKAK